MPTIFRRQRSFLFFFLPVVLPVVAILIAFLTLTHRKPAEAAMADRPRLAPGIVTRDVTFYSQALRRNMQYRVFLPEKRDQQLTVVYLLHGGGGTFRDWSNYSDVAQLAGSDLLLVMPQGDYSYYINAAARPVDRYEDYIVNDLPADVESRFPARHDGGGHAIIGVSMGGFGAVNLALRHPDRYAFAAAMSPAIDVPRRRFTWKRFNQSSSFLEIFGPQGSDSRRTNDPFVLAHAADPKSTPYLYLTCGRLEGLLAPNQEFAALLERRGFAHEFHPVPGGHEWSQWATQVPGVFASLRQHLNNDAAVVER